MITKEWQRTVNGQSLLISSAPGILPVDFVQEAFNTSAMFWAKASSATDTQTMLDNSCSLGLFQVQDGTKTAIGMARMITDYVTFAYLTDVYVVDEYRSFGLGKWLICCCKEIAQGIPELRWMLLTTGNEQAQRFYRRELGMEIMGQHADETTAFIMMGARKDRLPPTRAAELQAAES